MRKNEKMSKESLNRRLDKKLQNGDQMCKLTILRLSKGLTQEDLAERTGMKQSYIARIERGERETGKLTMINGQRLAHALGCRMEDLL